jgi:hypothetical protein
VSSLIESTNGSAEAALLARDRDGELICDGGVFTFGGRSDGTMYGRLQF